MEIFDNTEMRHYEVKHGEQLAIIEYQIQEKKVFLTRVEFPESFVEEGKDQIMINTTLDIIAETGMRIVPMTRIIKQFFRDHKERRKLLPVGIHL